MINLVTGATGTCKSALVVYIIDKLEKANKVNLQKNYQIFQDNLQLMNQYSNEFTYSIEEVGSGNLLKEEVVLLSDDYFDIFTQEFHNLRPDDYFKKSVIYNNIFERISELEDITYKELLPVRTVYSNIIALNIDYVRSLDMLIDNGQLDWRIAPDGSFIAIDEFQLIELFKNVKSDNPIIQEFTVHRHRGFDFYLITQSVTKVHVLLKDLINLHIHVTRPYNISTKLYYYGEFRQNPNSRSNKKTAEKTVAFNPPKRIFKLYKSTFVNTHTEKRIPWKFLIIVGLAFSFSISLMLYGFVFSKSNKEQKHEDTSYIQEESKQESKEEKQSNLDEISKLKSQIEIQKQIINYDKILLEKRLLALRSSRLSSNYLAEVKDSNIRVASIIKSKSKCFAYNKYGDKLNLDNCNDYKIIKARNSTMTTRNEEEKEN